MPTQQKMTRWYDPWQLANTGRQVLVSTLLGGRADYRLLEGSSTDPEIVDYSGEKELWIDYVADLGDGWNSTYAVASLLSSNLRLTDTDGKAADTQRGHVLIMGGDEVYPTASREAYEKKLVCPYECACSYTEHFHEEPPYPAIFAIPGNHDWYDGLVSFARLFCTQRWIGGWMTCQKRTYFALKLPQHWWLWGLDIQLESDIDFPQLDYFREVAKKMDNGDKVIIATPEPDWIYGNIYAGTYKKTNLAFLEKHVIQKLGRSDLKVALAGDLHHYRRHAAKPPEHGPQYITAGGGGAFLHPTWGPKVDTIEVGKDPVKRYYLQPSEYPDQKTCKKLLRRDLAFLFYNPTFGLLTGALYLAIAWIFRRPLLEAMSASAASPARSWVWALPQVMITSPLCVAAVLAVLAGVIAFTDTHIRWYKWLGGGLHGLSHLGGVILASWAGFWVSIGLFALSQGSLRQVFTSAVVVFLAGYVIGSELMGIYLYISLRLPCLRRHANEAFSALHIQDYKNFLRMHITPAGELVIYPVGICRVPRRWVPSSDATGRSPRFVPAEGEALSASLIEPAIKVS